MQLRLRNVAILRDPVDGETTGTYLASKLLCQRKSLAHGISVPSSWILVRYPLKEPIQLDTSIEELLADLGSPEHALASIPS